MHEFGMELPLCAELLVTCEVVQKNEGLLSNGSDKNQAAIAP